jgi:hypothetical protein
VPGAYFVTGRAATVLFMSLSPGIRVCVSDFEIRPRDEEATANVMTKRPSNECVL